MPILHFVQSNEGHSFLSGTPCTKQEFDNGGKYAEVCYSAEVEGGILIVEPDAVILETETIYDDDPRNESGCDEVLIHTALKDDLAGYRTAFGTTYDEALALYKNLL